MTTLQDASTRSTLADELRSGPLPPETATQLLWALCGLIEAEHQGVVKGDVDPEAVVLEDGLKRMAPRLLPKARAAGPFSAPERASSEPTPQSNVYSLGAVLYAALTGHAPDGRPLPETAKMLAPVVDRCLARDPTQRFSDVGELRRALALIDRTLVSGKVAAAAPIPLVQTQSLGPWRLEKLLGEGSMGQVFLARHEKLGRASAIKLLRPEQYRNRDLVQRFFQEARTVNQINHEHIVEIYDFVEEPGADGPAAVYCVMELLDGRSIDEELKRGPISLARTLNIVEQLADALAAAHRVGVVHRDVKPENVMLVHRAGQDDYVKVLDFGVAKLTLPDGQSMVSTMDGAIIGTPTCMSPEQVQGQPVDARTDIWAVGVILYRLLSGRLPFDAPTFTALAVKIATQPMPALPEVTLTGERIPPALKTLVARCLEKDREKRPQRMEEVRDVLRELGAGRRTLELEAPRPARRRTGVLAGLALGGVALAGAAAWYLLRPAGAPEDVRPAPPPPAVRGTEALPSTPVVSPPAPEATPPAVAPKEDVAPTQEALPGPGSRGSPQPPKPPSPRPVRLTPAIVQQHTQKLPGRVQQCLKQMVGSDQHPIEAKVGAVKVSITIEPTGEVSQVKLETPGLEGTATERCVLKEVRKVRFPPHVDAARTVGLLLTIGVAKSPP
jgi:serine/threonine-protein kinase